MIKAYEVGTMAFVVDTEDLVVRVRNGWKYVSVSIIECISEGAIVTMLSSCSFTAWAG